MKKSKINSNYNYSYETIRDELAKNSDIGELVHDNERAIAELENNKLDNPEGGSVGQVLTKTASGEAWQDGGGSGGDLYEHKLFFNTNEGYRTSGIIEFLSTSSDFNIITEYNKLVGAKITYIEKSGNDFIRYSGVVNSLTLSELDEPNDYLTGQMKEIMEQFTISDNTTSIVHQSIYVTDVYPSINLLLKEAGMQLYTHYSRKVI